MFKRKMSTSSGKTSSAHLLLFEAFLLYQSEYSAVTDVNSLKSFALKGENSGRNH